MTQHFDLGNTPLNKATPEVRERMVASMKRIFSGERLTYTDNEMELVMMGWQAEQAQLQEHCRQLEEQNAYLDGVASELQDTCDRQASLSLKQREVMQQALEALNQHCRFSTRDKTDAIDNGIAAIKALEEALK